MTGDGASSSRLPGRPARALVALGCLFGAMLALGNGLDRLSADHPAIAAKLPWPFASVALRIAGSSAIAEGDGQTGLAMGKAAVADSPIDPASSAILGAGRYVTGDRAGADQAFRVAGQLGWRVQATQLYWMSRALEARDYRVAALRLDAMLRQNPDLMRERQLMDPIERNGAARAALAARMPSAAWTSLYAGQMAGLPAETVAQRAMVLGELARQHGALGCDTIAPIVSRLIASGATLNAGQLWYGHCPGAASQLVYDGNFSRAEMTQDHSDFAWTFLGQSDVGLVLEPATNADQVLAVTSTAVLSRPFLRQLLLAKPGRYRLGWQISTAPGEPTDLVEAGVSCNPAKLDPLGARRDPALGRWSAEVTIDGACAGHWLVFWVKPGNTRLTMGAITLEPLG